MTRKQWTDHVRTILIRRRAALSHSLSEEISRGQAIEKPVGDEIADAALESLYGESRWQLAETESRELARVERALQRLEDGHYGICEDCDREIPMARLQALPHATTCIPCQRDRERSSAVRQSMINLGTRLWSIGQPEQ